MAPVTSPAKVLVTDSIHEEALADLKAHYDVTSEGLSPEDLLARIEGFDALIVRSRTKVTRQVLEAGTRLRVVGRAGVGVDNIDLATATERGVLVVNAPAGSTQSVAELTVGLMLALARRIPAADRSVKAGRWEKGALRGVELAGKVLGLVGSGRIGGTVAGICQALGMSVIAYDPYLPPEAARERGIRLTDLEEVLQSGDVVSIHAALTEETRHMIGEPELALMKRTAYLVNCARGAIVDEAALAESLRRGVIAGAGLDVYEAEPPAGSPLLALDNVVLTPHVAASTADAQRKAGLLTAEQVRKALEGERPEFLVNPEALSA